MLTVGSADTTEVPEEERFGFWHDLIARESVPMRVHSDHAADFRARAKVINLGEVVLSTWRYPSLDMQRTGTFIRRGDPEMYQFALPLSGHGGLEQERRTSALTPGHFAIVDTSRPHQSSHRGRSPQESLLTTLTVLVPHHLIPAPPRKIAQLLGTTISATEGMGALVHQFVHQVMTHPEQYQDGDAPFLGTVVRDLLAAAVAQHLDLTDALPQEVRGHSLRMRVRAFIDDHLGDPDLSPSLIAAAHHVSLRSLHRAFEAEGQSVAEVIRLSRLDRCARDLRDPLHRERPVHTIAARWGFSTPAHFSRVFTARFGMSPRAFRDSGPARRHDRR
ncbi:helix-turn-helix domain-containing protein [Micromonospora sp. WMMD1120]|uniref:AraC-like ligand-binding domain-containing protein n=1 Tax=Micromonospora sp. WMMD1120 TaxID=3016106 RepID=UPI002415BE8B|nr:helix-turn-helix domain-containing protein [Micromonospora sp. WMMD1120]MDG4809167.1 helix-turn-helix domain-containing protein [Micromonospora sp. WMMD1120]